MGSFVYVIFGSNKDVTIGPTAITAILTQPYVLKHGQDFAVSIKLIKYAIQVVCLRH